MNDLLKALNNSKETSNEEDLIREKTSKPAVIDTTDSTPTKVLKRRYVDVADRRMPWSLFSKELTNTEKAHTLAVYIKLMSINSYRQARRSANFASWPPPIQIVEESTKILPMRSTRSGRTVPSYSGFDEDSTDFDFLVHSSKPKRRKVSTSQDIVKKQDEIYSNKVVSLKRKTSKDESSRPAKEPKLNEIGNGVKPKHDMFTLIED
ncbi:Glutamate synthase (NADPH) [Operophtera brumata]|uniref:Glutamate synthase (NADPH) n=1 Tax=Operophtera brumata TaxID=104452 RepID=A0A0L7L254_OPEBR|nr:Glutamate synthase (NADPH) [Operophtera brumata]